MIFTAFALAAAMAATPPTAKPAPNTGGEVLIPSSPTTPRMNVSSGEPARCAAIVREVLFKHGIIDNGESAKGATPGTWQPGAYPEAGAYAAVNKTIAGCSVPVPISAHIPPGGVRFTVPLPKP